MYNASKQINVVDLIERSKIKGFHVNLIVLSFLVMLMDGFDLQAIGYVAPSMIKAWQVSRASFSGVFSAALVGMMIGATQGGSLGDRWGRKITILLGVIVFGLFTLLAAGASDISELIILRFLAGIGLGCAVPNAVALNTEYAPKKYCATMVTVMFLGFTIGAALAGGAAAILIPQYGWPAVFIVGGIASLVVAVLCYFFLPESVRFQILRRGDSEEARKTLQKLTPGSVIGSDVELIVQEENRPGIPLAYLFRDGRARFTVLLWICFISNLITVHFIHNWLPTVIESTGVSLQRAVIVTTLFSAGGTLGGLLISRLLDRGSLFPLVFFFGLAAPMIVSIGQVSNSGNMLEIVVFAAGLLVVGGQFGLNALAGISYPTFIRSTGVGWALGIGRIGSILGPIVGGILITLKLPLSQIFLYGAVPMLVGCTASFLLIAMRRSAVRREQAEAMQIVAAS